MKAVPAPWSLAYKKRTYSPNRIKYPLKRVDWDPERRAQPAEPRQEQVRAHLLGRGHRPHRRRDQADPQGVRPAGHPGPGRRPRRVQDGPRAPRLLHAAARQDGRLHPAGPQPRQLGRLVLGRQARVGQGPHRHDGPGRQHREGHLPRTATWWSSGAATRRPPPGASAASSPAACSTSGPRSASSRSTSAPTSTTRRHPRRQVDPHPAQHRRGPAARHHARVDHRGHLRQGVRRRPTPWASTRSKAYVLGEEDGIPKTPEWASAKCGVPAWTIKALARDWAKKTVTIGHYFGGGMARGPYSTSRPASRCVLLGMQGLGKPGVHQAQIAYTGMPKNVITGGADHMGPFANLTATPAGDRLLKPHQRHADRLGQADHPQDPHRRGHPGRHGATSGAPAATRSRPPTSSRSTRIPSPRRRAAPRST